jgi:hypothetical protein
MDERRLLLINKACLRRLRGFLREDARRMYDARTADFPLVARLCRLARRSKSVVIWGTPAVMPTQSRGQPALLSRPATGRPSATISEVARML